jgi:hypothetical protein
LGHCAWSRDRSRGGFAAASTVDTSVDRGNVATPAHVVAFLIGGFLAWLPFVIHASMIGTLRPFLDQVVMYDLGRLANPGPERASLFGADHLARVWDNLALGLVLIGPALAALLVRTRFRKVFQYQEEPRPSGRAAVGSQGAETAYKKPPQPGAAALRLLAWHCPLVVAIFCVSPFGYGHYLLQAVPSAAILVAAFIQRVMMRHVTWYAAALTAALGLFGAAQLGDHFRFTFDSSYEYREAYRALRERADRLVAVASAQSEPDEAVMFWPPDYGVSYVARRRTPLEGSNADLIFKGKSYRLSPPMDALLAKLKADPPQLIIDTTGFMTRQLPTPDGGMETAFLLEAGVSLSEEPDEQHVRAEGRLLAPLKRWLRHTYGGQMRIEPATLFFIGGRWQDPASLPPRSG